MEVEPTLNHEEHEFPLMSEEEPLISIYQVQAWIARDSLQNATLHAWWHDIAYIHKEICQEEHRGLKAYAKESTSLNAF